MPIFSSIQRPRRAKKSPQSISGLSHRRSAFTLIELLVSIGIFSIILLLTLTILSETQNSWQKANSRVSQFRDARLAFELITRNLNQATLNTYFAYQYQNSGSIIPDNSGALPDRPANYIRQSELQFLTGYSSDYLLPPANHPTHCTFFQALLGFTTNANHRNLGSLLNGRGYYIAYTDDSFDRPNFFSGITGITPPQYRFRLMEFIPPTENNEVYQADIDYAANNNSTTDMAKWFSDPTLLAAHSRPVASNIIALVISPRRSRDASSTTATDNPWDIAPNYKYDSKNSASANTFNLLPPLLEVTLVAIDEGSAARYEIIHGTGSTAPALVDPTWFQNPANYDTDLADLEQKLIDENLDYRVFSTTINLRAAKWSQ